MRSCFLVSLGLFVVTACGGSTSDGLTGTGGASTGGASTGGASTGGVSGSAGASTGGATSGGSGGVSGGGSGGTSSGGSGGGNTGGTTSGGTGGGNTGGTTSGGSGGGNTGGTTSGGSGGGNTGGTGGGNTGGTGFGGTGGGPTITCADLENAYAKALESAKSCNPFVSVILCDTSMPDELACPCPTMVNHNNTISIQALKNLKSQWDSMGCGKNVMCPAIACVAPSSGACVGSGSGTQGTCKDLGLAN
jgi:hypothetical protein